jgi:hypothetical protein
LQYGDGLPVCGGLHRVRGRKLLRGKLRGEHGLSGWLCVLVRRGSVPTGLPARLELRQRAHV